MKDRHLHHETAAAVGGLTGANHTIRSCPGERHAPKRLEIWSDWFDSLGFAMITKVIQPRSTQRLGISKSSSFFVPLALPAAAGRPS
jgi:hypothetical protein